MFPRQKQNVPTLKTNGINGRNGWSKRLTHFVLWDKTNFHVVFKYFKGYGGVRDG